MQLVSHIVHCTLVLISDVAPGINKLTWYEDVDLGVSEAFPTTLSQSILASMQTEDPDSNLAEIQPNIGIPVSIDVTDGVRMTFDNDDIVHLRPSGNAPELRCYTESNSQDNAERLNQECISLMKQWQWYYFKVSSFFEGIKKSVMNHSLRIFYFGCLKLKRF